MKNNHPIRAGILLRKLSTPLCAAAPSTAVLAGCGGESSADTNSSVTLSKQKTGVSKKSSRDGLPEDFPDDVPLPEFASAKMLGSPAGAGDSWNVLFMLKSPTQRRWKTMPRNWLAPVTPWKTAPAAVKKQKADDSEKPAELDHSRDRTCVN